MWWTFYPESIVRVHAINDETFSKRDFTTHMKDLHTSCVYTAICEEYLNKHIKPTHDGEAPEEAAALRGYRIHQCNFCDYISDKMSNFKQHPKQYQKNVELKAGDKEFTILGKKIVVVKKCNRKDLKVQWLWILNKFRSCAEETYACSSW